MDRNGSEKVEALRVTNATVNAVVVLSAIMGTRCSLQMHTYSNCTRKGSARGCYMRTYIGALHVLENVLALFL